VTSAEFRRRAGALDAEASALADDADRLQFEAAALDGILDPLVAISQRVWTGPAAQDFEANVRWYSSIVSQQARELGRIAHDLRRQAVVARGEAAVLRARALAADAAVAVANSVSGVV